MTDTSLAVVQQQHELEASACEQAARIQFAAIASLPPQLRDEYVAICRQLRLNPLLEEIVLIPNVVRGKNGARDETVYKLYPTQKGVTKMAIREGIVNGWKCSPPRLHNDMRAWVVEITVHVKGMAYPIVQWGSCAIAESKSQPWAVAETRAKNRVFRDLTGLGLVTLEEMDGYDPETNTIAGQGEFTDVTGEEDSFGSIGEASGSSSEPAADDPLTKAAQYMVEGEAIYLLKSVKVVGGQYGLNIELRLSAKTEDCSTRIFRGWEQALADLGYNAASVRENMVLQVNRLVVATLVRKDRYWNVDAPLRYYEEEQEQSPLPSAPSGTTPPSQPSSEASVTEPTPATTTPETGAPAAPASTSGGTTEPRIGVSTGPLTELEHSLLLYQERRVRGGSWGEARERLDRLMLDNVEKRIQAGSLRITGRKPVAIDLPSLAAGDWIHKYKAAPDNAAWNANIPFSEADALDYLRGKWDSDIGDLGSPLDMTTPLGTPGD